MTKFMEQLDMVIWHSRIDFEKFMQISWTLFQYYIDVN